jgi:WD repeat-containing protein 76
VRQARLPRHQDLDLEVLLGGDADDKGRAELAIQLSGLCGSSHPGVVGDAHDWDEDKTNPEKVRLREELKKMKVVSRAKVTQDRVYSMAYHPEPVSCVTLFHSRL